MSYWDDYQKRIAPKGSWWGVWVKQKDGTSSWARDSELDGEPVVFHDDFDNAEYVADNVRKVKGVVSAEPKLAVLPVPEGAS